MSNIRPLARWAGPIAISIAHLAVAWLSLELTWWSAGLASIWPANAILLTALLTTRRRHAWRYVAAVMVGSAIANGALLSDPLMPTVFAASNIVECLVAAMLMRRLGALRFDLERLGDLTRFGAAALAAAAVSASISAPLMLLLRGLPLGQSWLSWFTSDALGLLLVTPVLLIARDLFLRWRAGRRIPRVGEALLLMALVAALSFAVFRQTSYPLLFALTPLVSVATYRLRSFGAAIATIIVAIIGSWCTVTGTGPMALIEGGIHAKVYLLQIYLAATFLGALPVAAVLAERDALARAAMANAADAEALAVEAQRIAATDELTGVASRRKLLARLDDEIRVSEKSGRALAVALFDVDHFKRINDSMGHEAGDRVLKGLADLAAATVRSADLVGRLDGEEFAIVMPGATAEQAIAIAERLRLASERTHLLSEDFAPVTISLGVAALAPGQSRAALLKAADKALYAAKAQGRNRLKLAA